MSAPGATPIAIVGLGGIFPGRGDITGFWRDLFEGRDLLTPVPPSHWLLEDYYDADMRAPDRTYGKRGGFLSPVAFDPLAFGISPKAMEATDSAQLLALVAAKMALEDIERDSAGKIDKTRTSVILGVASATELTAHMAGRLQRPVWVNALRQAGLPENEVQDVAARMEGHYTPWQEATFPGLLGNVVAGRIANRLDLGGSNYVTDAACASSLSALQIALHELRAGDSDTVLAGGVDALNDILMYMCFSKTPALSPTGDCRPFSTEADGTMLGEAVGILALRRLEDAERDGNTIHAVIRGLGGASDGAGTAIYSPRAGGQARALIRAYEQAGYGPEAVDLVEAHGTGTKAGDKAELDGLHQVFGEVASDAPWCALGSVKSQIGHTKASAGAASLIKAVQALSRKVMPATIKVEEPAEAVRDSKVFYLNTEPRPWIAPEGRPRRASVSSFGFGGSNFHVTLEEYTGKRAVKPYRTLPAELFVFSGRDAGAVADAIKAAATALTEAGMPLAASTSHAAFKPGDRVRVSITADSPEDFTAKAADMATRLKKGTLSGPFKPGCHAAMGKPREGEVAFMFAGQGSQYVGMGADLAMGFPAARAAWDRAASHARVGPLRLDKLSFPPAAFDQVEFSQSTERLTQMEHAQPAIAAVALAQLDLAAQLGLKPGMTGGHSFGEVMALHAAGAMKEDAVLTLSAARGALMAEAARTSEGSMLAVQADADTVAPILKKLGKSLVLANDNAPDQVVLSGPSEVVKRAEAEAKKLGLKARFLPVATAFHSEIVASAVEPFQAAIEGEKVKAPKLPVYANATAAPYAKSAKSLPAALASQIASPVRFREEVEAMYEAGARIFVEFGPGSVVSGLVSNILGTREHLAVPLDHKRRNGVAQFLHAVGTLCAEGAALNLQALFADLPPAPAQPAPPKHAIMISGANLGKPYPPAAGAAGPARPNPPRQNAAPAQPSISSQNSSMTQKPPQPPFTPPPAPSPVAPQAGAATERMLEELSRRHAEYVHALTSAHTAFMSAASQLLGGAPMAGQPVAAPQYQPMPQPAPPAYPSMPMPAPAPQPQAYSAPAPQPAAPAPVAPAPVAPTPVQAAPAPAPALVPAAMPPAMDATALVRSIIAEKTGYPEDMLDAGMDLEGELGVDSIKQVEILSTLREHLPALPEIDPEQLVELRSISAIAGMIEESGVLGGAPAAAPAQAPAARPAYVNGSAGTPRPNGAAGTQVSVETVRALIAEKTGYPEDMLEETMDLEGELGVDSIKQVEILSALRDRHPHLPEVDPEVLAELRTIKAIADFFA